MWGHRGLGCRSLCEHQQHGNKHPLENTAQTASKKPSVTRQAATSGNSLLRTQTDTGPPQPSKQAQVHGLQSSTCFSALSSCNAGNLHIQEF